MKGKRNTLTPKLRFPEFKEGPGWNAVNGDKLFDLIDRRPAPPGLPILAITQEHGAIPRDHIDYHVSVTEASLASYKEVYPADFIISLRSFQGGIEYSRFHGICSPAYLILRRKGIGCDDFFRHLFKSDRFIQQLTRNIEGIRDGKMISYKQFAGQLLPAPDSAEQRKIAACLTSLDEWIAVEGRKLEVLQAHKNGLMQRLFPREGHTRPRLRFPEFRDAGEWKGRKIRDLLEKVSLPIEVEAEQTYREIGVRSHGKGIFHKDQVKGSTIGTKRVFRVVEDAFVLNIVFAWEQAVAFTTKAESGMIASHRFPMFLPKENACDVRFIKLAFLTPTGKQLLGLASPGGAGRNRTLGQDEFEKVEIVVPETDEQTRIADAVLAADALIAAQSQKVDALRIHKLGLIQRLFPSPDEK